jgi:hypothetical protein
LIARSMAGGCGAATGAPSIPTTSVNTNFLASGR